MLSDEFTELNAKKIRLMLKAAIKKRMMVLVLRVISCGAFQFKTYEGDRFGLSPDQAKSWTLNCVIDAYNQ